MLQELIITNFAIIDHLRLTPGERLNVFTGETGAGKSIILDAISALVGERLGADVVRAGSERASVEGVFDVATLLTDGSNHIRSTPGFPAQDNGATANARQETGEDGQSETLADVLAELAIEIEDGMLILAREITSAGRSIARVNGRAVPLATLQRITSQLIDIHGQSAHLAILRPERHVYYLDRYANTDDLREQVARLVTEWRATRREYERLRRNEREIERRIELLRYQVDEITAAQLVPGELDDLERERSRLANAERLEELCATIYGALAGDEREDTPGALALLTTARRAMSDLLRLDDSLREQNDTLEQAYYLLEDVASATRAYQEEIAANPQRQAEVEERLDLIARLRRKYGATIEEILAFAEEAAHELDELAHRDERAAALQQRELALRQQIGEVAGRLSERRQAASAALGAAMERELDELNMQRARFETHINRQPDPDGAPVTQTGQRKGSAQSVECYAFTATGIDQVEFLIAPNPGEPFKPLARIASGGETSRLMLALKTILSNADATPILIFDEIDAGISGRSGQVVGEKLWALGQTHQVLCVTHLPQIAAMGDVHFHVAKVIHDDRTTTEARQLTPEERTEELGQMLGGASTRAARANATELLERSAAWKHAAQQQPHPILPGAS
ncbi:MAG TPA: DNA repair protein RecN [Ktedonobacterales bacterium]|nr:DNA repair protein RecN [Ktedonobacterales bacterium]